MTTKNEQLNKTVVVCGKLDGFHEDALRLQIYTGKGRGNIKLQIGDIHKSLFKTTPDRFTDLLEIATYVYCADQAVSRASGKPDTYGELWRRNFEFHIPVRDPDFWTQPKVIDCLVSTLSFLSDDIYNFNFVGQATFPPVQAYLNIIDNEMLGSPEQVMLFSGGIDSLGGAINEAIAERRKVILVRHKSNDKYAERHKELKEKLELKCKGNEPIFITVSVNKDKELSKEYTQRSRSFLFACLAATIAKMIGQSNIRFYENGVVSLNLPMCGQVIGGRATRTTHPKVINGYQKLLSFVADESFSVENLFITKTKGEVFDFIAQHSCQDLIPLSISCAHPWRRSNKKPHCGTCSQCIDRRLAGIASGKEEYDPLDGYDVDIFRESLSKNKDAFNCQDKTMLAVYIDRANRIRKMNLEDFTVSFPEAARVFLYLSGNPTANALKIYDLYKRHAVEICKAIDIVVAKSSSEIREGNLPNDCLIRLVSDTGPFIPIKSTTQDEMAENCFFREGEPWRVRFKGKKPFILLPSKGCTYLQQLLSEPNKEHPILEIADNIAQANCESEINKLSHTELKEGFQVSNNPALSSYDTLSDIDSLKDYRLKLKEIDVEIEDAKRNANEYLLNKSEEEKADIIRHINGIIDHKGNLRAVNNKKKNLQDSFRSAVKNTIDKIKEFDLELAEHLTSSIEFGSAPIYKTEETFDWFVTDVTNNSPEKK